MTAWLVIFVLFLHYNNRRELALNGRWQTSWSCVETSYSAWVIKRLTVLFVLSHAPGAPQQLTARWRCNVSRDWWDCGLQAPPLIPPLHHFVSCSTFSFSLLPSHQPSPHSHTRTHRNLQYVINNATERCAQHKFPVLQHADIHLTTSWRSTRYF